MKFHARGQVTIVAIVLGLSGCASIPPEDRAEYDPWEPLNRSVFTANLAVDKVTTRPLARGYRKIVPRPIRKGVSNFFRNLTTPRSALNNFLQGKPGRGFSEIGRFLFNSTIGIAGVIDVASAGGMDEYREDFGQTAAVWGVPDGPYVMLPLLGPQTLRDALMMPLDIITTLLYQYDNTSVRDKLYFVRLIDLRYQLLAAEKFLEDSTDAYITTRESYLQNRNYAIHDGDVPEEDDFFDEFFDEE